MELHFKIIGSLLMVLALVHVIFPRYFKWQEELPALSLINQQIMQVHTFFIALMVFLMGALCLVEAAALVNTPLGKNISVGLAIFWTFRLLIQFFGYSSELWRGKAFETGVHVVFSVFWVYLGVVFWWNGLG